MPLRLLPSDLQSRISFAIRRQIAHFQLPGERIRKAALRIRAGLLIKRGIDQPKKPFKSFETVSFCETSLRLFMNEFGSRWVREEKPYSSRSFDTKSRRKSCCTVKYPDKSVDEATVTFASKRPIADNCQVFDE
jgi:hypothetical protein